jgi:hypothetical protein
VERVRAIIKFVALICLIFAIVNVGLVHGWSNGGYSTTPTNPKYGTHDWIAQHALDWLSAQEKQYIINNLAAYLFGTELPDNSNAPGGDGIGDTTKHHVYYSASGTVTDDASAQRANTEYNIALNYLKAQDWADAAKTAGTMTHYIDDMAVFGHVMGASTPWGNEVHHSDYEDYVDARTGSYSGSGNFNGYLSFDGTLSTITAYNGALNLAYDTTFGGSNHLTCVWMDTNYNWSNPTFVNRCGESLNLAVNTVTDVLHTLYLQAGLSNSPTSTPTGYITTPTDAINPSSTKNLNGSTVSENASIILILSGVIAVVTILLIMLTFVQIRMRKSRKLSKEHR